MPRFEVWYTYLDNGSKIIFAEDEADAAEKIKDYHLEVLSIDQVDNLGDENDWE